MEKSKFNIDIFKKSVDRPDEQTPQPSPAQEQPTESAPAPQPETESGEKEGIKRFNINILKPAEDKQKTETAPNDKPATVTAETVTSETVTTDAGKEYTDVIRIHGLRQIFNEGKENEYRLFDGFDLDIPDFEGEGQFISIMGASGCGKTCLLRALAGLTTIPEGEIRIYGKPVKEYGNVPMLFQQYSSYEWMTVLDNVALPMVLKKMPMKEAREKAMHFIELVGLTGHEMKYAKTPALSGGQLQRVSIARCLAGNSQIMLLDEATSALDVKMKREVQNILLDIFQRSDVDPTIINVTHNIEEAIYLSNRIIVLEANPCRVFKTMDVHFTGEKENKRGPWVLETQEFLQYTKELTKTLDEVCSIKK